MCQRRRIVNSNLMRMRVLALLLSLNHQQTQCLPKMERQYGPFPNFKQQWRLSASNIIKMVPGPTRYAVSHVEDLKSSFEIFMTPSIKNTVLRMTNLEGRCVYGDSWKDLAKRVMVDLAEGLRVHNFTCNNFFHVSCLG